MGITSEKAYINKKVIMGYGIVVAVLFAAYIMELVKGNRTAGYIAIFSALLLIPFVACLIVYKFKPESNKIRYSFIIGYGVLYAFVMFTSTSMLNFTYILPVIVIFSMCQNRVLSIIIGIVATAINAGYVVMTIISHEFEKSEIVDFEIEIAVIVQVSGLSALVCHVLEKVGNNRLSAIEDEKTKTKELFDSLVENTNIVSENIHFMDDKANVMTEDSQQNLVSITEIVNGTNELAETIQKQLQMSGDITTKIDATNQNMTELKCNCIC